jgi:hypothetical protein
MGENKKTVMESAVQALNSRGVLFSGSLYLYTEFLLFTFYFLLSLTYSTVAARYFKILST